MALIRGCSRFSRAGRDRRPRPEACRPPSDAGTDVFGGVQFGVGARTCKKRRVIWGVHLSERTPSSRAGWCRLPPPEVRAFPMVVAGVDARSGQAADARPFGVPGTVESLAIGEPIQPSEEVAEGVDPPRAVRGEHVHLARPAVPVRLESQVHPGRRDPPSVVTDLDLAVAPDGLDSRENLFSSPRPLGSAGGRAGSTPGRRRIARGRPRRSRGAAGVESTFGARGRPRSAPIQDVVVS